MINTSTKFENIYFFFWSNEESYNNMLSYNVRSVLVHSPLIIYPNSNKSGKYQKKKKEKYQCWETILILILRPLNVIPKK
jgi:hypothetical protein